MGLLQKIKSLLPGSSRSLHQMHELTETIYQDVLTIYEVRDKLQNIHDDMWRIRDHHNYEIYLNRKLLEQSLNFMKDMDAHQKMLLWENLRQPDESIDETKKRFFLSLPKATGNLRLLQLVNIELLKSFNELCEQNDIAYWMMFGTLLGALRHKGFIPWDDDVDVALMRSDFEKLCEVVKSHPQFKITLRYDRYVYCKQYRFCYNDEEVPCFIDLFVFDYASENSSEVYTHMLDVRKAMIAETEQDERLTFWGDHDGNLNSIIEGTNEHQALIEPYFSAVYETLLQDQIITPTDAPQTETILWGYENMYTEGDAFYMYDASDIFPLQKLSFEGLELWAPHNAEKILTEEHGDIYAFPYDITSHEHIARQWTSNSKEYQAIQKKLTE